MKKVLLFTAAIISSGEIFAQTAPGKMCIEPQYRYWTFFLPMLVLLAVIIYYNKTTLRDSSTATAKPFSYSKVQLAWWSIIVLSCFSAVFICTGHIPTFWNSTLVLLGIAGATTTTAALTDVSDKNNPTVARAQDGEGENFLLDILSDSNGVSVHRLQAVVFNITYGIWFVITFIKNLHSFPGCTATSCVDCSNTIDGLNAIIPDICTNGLVLLGLSSGTYAALKLTENKQTQAGILQITITNYTLYSSISAVLTNTNPPAGTTPPAPIFIQNGTATINSLTPGNYTLTVTATPSDTTQPKAVMTKPVTIASGNNTITLP